MTEQPIVLGDRYRLTAMIGRGGMAEVWRATDTRLDREVAVKRLKIDLATDPTFQARFQREAQSAAGLNHPNIVSVYDTGRQVDPNTGLAVPYIVMELVQGKSLRDLLRESTRIPAVQAFEWTRGVLDALAYSHRRGIVHRDIKPANVMLTGNNIIKVMDFGIARAVSDTSATMTQTAAVIGTAQYLSPEQARGETVDARSDIYSTGCLLYELLTSRPPFIGDSPVSVAYQHVRELPLPPSQLNPEITPQMDAIVMTSLAKDPLDRYQSAQDMRDDIDRLLQGERVVAVMPAPAAAATRVMPADGALSDSMVMRAASTDTMLPIDEYDEDEPPKKRKVSPATIILLSLLGVLLVVIGVVVFKMMNPSDPETIQVPAVIGYTEDMASSTLTNANLQVKVEHKAGDEETKGTVIEQDPTGGTEVQVGSTVTITINDGPDKLTIPEGLEGLTEADAKARLTEAGIKSNTSQAQNEPATAVAGTVVSTSPAGGSEIGPNDYVTIYLATGRSMMPDLVGMTQADAMKKANDAGFTNVTPVPQERAGVIEGTVFSQNPTANTTTTRTDPVTIYIAVAPATPQTSEPAPPSPTTTS